VSIFVVAVSPASLSSTKASTCGEKTIPAPFYFFPTRMPRRRSPGRRPTATFGAMPRPLPEPSVQAHV
jgi:hypothetical protein